MLRKKRYRWCVSCTLTSFSGVREEADGSVTYCLVGNGLTIMADEEYLTISSTLEPSHSFPSTHTPTSTLTGPSSQTSNTSSSCSSQNPSLSPHTPAMTTSPLTPPTDTLTTCPLAHPAQPLTTQPPKAQHHPVQQGALPLHYKALHKNSWPVVPLTHPPAPPVTPITAQVISSVPPCVSPAALAPTLREEPERKERTYRDDDDEDEEEEEERRRKASL